MRLWGIIIEKQELVKKEVDEENDYDRVSIPLKFMINI